MLTVTIPSIGKQGIFQSVGSQRIARFPVYKEVAGFNIYLRFSTTTCRGHLAEITTMDSNYYVRLTLLDTGPIRLSFNTLHGKGQLDLSMPSAGNFCDGKTHVMILKLFSGAVSYGVDGSPVVRFFVSRLSVLFPSPANITIGRKFEGCVSDSTVVNRFNETQEYVVGISRDCHSHSKYLIALQIVFIWGWIKSKGKTFAVMSNKSLCS